MNDKYSDCEYTNYDNFVQEVETQQVEDEIKEIKEKNIVCEVSE